MMKKSLELIDIKIFAVLSGLSAEKSMDCTKILGLNSRKPSIDSELTGRM
jgi:hypothetical protein